MRTSSGWFVLGLVVLLSGPLGADPGKREGPNPTEASVKSKNGVPKSKEKKGPLGAVVKAQAESSKAKGSEHEATASSERVTRTIPPGVEVEGTVAKAESSGAGFGSGSASAAGPEIATARHNITAAGGSAGASASSVVVGVSGTVKGATSGGGSFTAGTSVNDPAIPDPRPRTTPDASATAGGFSAPGGAASAEAPGPGQASSFGPGSGAFTTTQPFSTGLPTTAAGAFTSGPTSTASVPTSGPTAAGGTVPAAGSPTTCFLLCFSSGLDGRVRSITVAHHFAGTESDEFSVETSGNDAEEQLQTLAATLELRSGGTLTLERLDGGGGIKFKGMIRGAAAIRITVNPSPASGLPPAVRFAPCP